MQKSPLIGISGSIEHDESRQFIVRDYMRSVAEAGGVPLLMSMDMTDRELEACLNAMDGILLAGGNDVDPSLYDEHPHPCIGEIDPLRDAFESRLIELLSQRDLPVLAICRGIQILNVARGGNVYQDLPKQFKGDGTVVLGHDQTAPASYPSHTVQVAEHTLLHEIVGQTTLRVNSFHHEAVDRLAPSLTACAVAPDGVIEGVYDPNARFVLGVQWHPERMRDDASRKLFAAFIAASAQKEPRHA